MTGAETLEGVLRGPLAGQKPKRVGTLRADVWLSIAVVILVCFGSVMVLDVSYFHAERYTGDPYFFFRKHVTAVVLGAVAAWLASLVSSDVHRRLAYPALLLALVALGLVLVPGVGAVRGGAQRWIALGGASLQPSEFAKLALLLYLAASIVRKANRMGEFTRGVLPHLVVGAVVAGLLVVEPDYGGAALSVLLVAILLFAGGARLWHLAAVASAAAPVLLVVLLVAPYRLQRVADWLFGTGDPLGSGYQLHQSLIAFGSGQLLGRGLGESQQKLEFLPAAHTDFIYAVVGEEFGLVGGLLVLGLFGLIAARGLRIAMRHPDPFGRLLAVGLTSLLTCQALLNVGVVLGCLPTKGLVLPFISYGGSAMLVALVEVGMLLALARESR
jgi:cell division protein FtsW